MHCATRDQHATCEFTKDAQLGWAKKHWLRSTEAHSKTGSSNIVVVILVKDFTGTYL